MSLNLALNYLWIYGNIAMTLPFLYSGYCRFLKRKSFESLDTDHICRVLLIFSWLFYALDIFVKTSALGTEGICEKAFLVHHIGALITIPPLFLNDYIPWWVSPLGWMHGIFRVWPQHFWLNYVYVGFVFLFHYQIHKNPFRKMKYYGLSRFAVNYIHVFFLMVLLGKGCRNYFSLEE